MGQTKHGKFYRKLKGARFNSAYKKYYKGSKMNADFDWMFYEETCEKRGKKKYTHVDTILTVYRNLPLPITNTLSNTHNNTIPQVDYYKTNLSTSYCAD